MADEDVVFQDTEDVAWAVGQDVEFAGQILILGGRRVFIFDNTRRTFSFDNARRLFSFDNIRRMFTFDNARRVLNFDNVRRILEIS